MRRVLFAAACVVTFGAAYYFRCRHVSTKRHPMGGYRCPDCLRAFSDLAQAGLMDGEAYVGPLSTGWRDNGVERTAR